jgi:hypothetical protein
MDVIAVKTFVPDLHIRAERMDRRNISCERGTVELDLRRAKPWRCRRAERVFLV